MERYSVCGHFSRSDFVKLPLLANSEPRVISFFSWNLVYLSFDAVLLHFLKNSSSVSFKGSQIVSNLSFLQFRISCFLERLLSGCIFDRFFYTVCFWRFYLCAIPEKIGRGEARAPCTPSLNPPWENVSDGVPFLQSHTVMSRAFLIFKG